MRSKFNTSEAHGASAMKQATANTGLAVAHAVRRALRGHRARLGLLRGLSLACAIGLNVSTAHAELPVLCVSGLSCGNSAAIINDVTRGISSIVSTATSTTVTQSSANALLNWKSFNISSGSSVRFIQPDASSIALNRIYQDSASQIFGNLNANGRVYLLNQNGIVFGNGAQVNVAALIASSLDITPNALNADGSTNLLNGVLQTGAAFQLFAKSGVTGDISVLPGATITTNIPNNEGGQVLMFAPNVYNQGSISTPGGQTVLAAGTSVYLAESKDKNLRGILVEVSTDGMTDVGTVTNGVAGNADVTNPAALVGQIVAERGNITLAGLAVNQLGRVSATTTINQNGSIRLQARSGGYIANAETGLLGANDGGVLTIGKNSVSEVTLSTSKDATVDTTQQQKSKIELSGKEILVLDDAKLTAKGGSISVVARANPLAGLGNIDGNVNDGSRIYVADGALLDVSGTNITKDMESNVISFGVFGSELADSPVQRDGVLYRKTVSVDIRQGTPLTDIAPQTAAIARDVSERNLLGGNIKLESQGDVVVAAGSTLDISGGSITFRDGYINTTKLLGADGKVYDIAKADPNKTYTGLFTGSTYSTTDARWGVTKTYTSQNNIGRFEQGYVEGKDAGTINILSARSILDGDIKAVTQVGRYQRQLSTTLTTGQIYRAYSELPWGGSLNLGRAATENSNDQVTGDVLFGGSAVLPTLSGFDIHGTLPNSVTATQLRSELFGDDRIAHVTVYANGEVTLPESVALQLPGQGSLTVQAAQVDVAGDVYTPSGTIAITSVETATNPSTTSALDINIASTTSLDVSGRWINDSPLLNANNALLTPVFINGGAVTLSSKTGSLSLHDGSVIDVSGGAWADANGNVSGGSGGAITLSAKGSPQSLGESVVLSQGAQLKGYGFAKGGELKISAPEICIATDGVCGTAVASTLMLTPQDFLSSGFSKINLSSNERGLLVESGTQINLQQRNFWLNDNALSIATGAPVSSIATSTTLPDYLRSATDLTLTNAEISEVNYNNANFANVQGLVLEQGSSINGDVGASISLQSNTVMEVNGQIIAHGGTINLTLDNKLNIAESLDAQGIWLGNHSRLDVSGATLLQPDRFGLRTGTVWQGGKVNIVAQRGAVIANADSQIDISGTSATLDIAQVSGAVTNTTPRLIASNAGALNITAADAIVLGGNVNAHVEAGTHAEGGHLSLQLNANDRYGSTKPLLPIEERRIVVSQSGSPVSIAARTDLPQAFANQSQISADRIMSAGFSSVSLVAETSVGKLSDGSPEFYEPGAIQFVDNVNLTLGRELILDAARITGNGKVTLNAPYVALGHANTTYQQTRSSQQGTAGELNVLGDFIEVVGNSTIDGFENVTLSSQGDIRLRGIQQNGTKTVQGSLQTNADLKLRADQIYATTLSDFDVSLVDNADGVLRVESTGQPRDVVLSAASQLTLNAPTIEQAGVLRAPFGTIELNADNLILEAGSLTSTSAENAIIPFGAIQAGKDWVYNLKGQTVIVGDTTPTPEKQVSLSGDQVSINSGAVIDVSGGGDLLAYEFISGTGGKHDVLSIAEAPGRFAIVPTLSLGYAPFDPQESVGSSLKVGDTIHLSTGVNGLPEGDYVLLPARYALLDGAFVVEAAKGYTDLSAGQSIQQLNGSTVVSGYRTVANTAYADARTGGFTITPATVLAKQARYNTSLASDFFAEQATANNTAVPRLPQDAGVLSIAAVSQLNIDGQLRAAAATGARGAAVDISAANLVVSESAVAGNGEVVVSANDLTALGAESLLLGGSRSSTDAGVSLDVSSSKVTIASDAVLSTPELLIAATDTVRVASGAKLTASGELPTTDTYLVSGDGAMLRLASGEQAEIRRSNESGVQGSLVLESGSLLTATGGALALDASLETQSAATLALQSGSLSLGASHINLSNQNVTAAGLTLNAAQLSSLQLNQLALVSRSNIDVYGDVALSVNDLSIDAAGLRNQQGSTNAAITAADRITLSNRAQRSDTDAGASSGTLQLNADNIVISEGSQRITGFDHVALIADTQVRGEQQGGINVVGDLTLSTPVLLAGTGASTNLTASGDLRVVVSDAVAAAQDKQLGGTLSLTGAAVTIASRVEAAAGKVVVNASSGDVSLINGAVIDVAGRTRDFDGTVVAASAGEVNLESTHANVVAQSGSSIKVAAAADGAAGHLNVKATQGSVTLNGELQASAVNASNSGSVSIDANNVGDFSALTAALNTGGFNAERSIRQRGAGDLVLNSGSTVTAQQLDLTADQGSIVINGAINARGEDGGKVVLSAKDNVTLNGSVLASATTASGEGGELSLRATDGAVRINSSAHVDLTAGTANTTDGGELNLRVARVIAGTELATTLTDADTSNDGVVLAGTFSGVKKTTLEAYERYEHNGSIGSSDVSTSGTWYSDASAFIATHGGNIKSALGRTNDATFRLLPGVEIQSTNDLSLDSDWNLYNWNFDGAPGVLTLRAAGNLTFNRSLSDGFNGASGTTATATAFNLSATPRDSWSYRLVAGADASSADLMATGNSSDADFTIASGTVPTSTTNPGTYRMVRTGNGSIDVAASGDFILGNQASVLYTAGVASTATNFTIGSGVTGLGGRVYPVDGGDIDIDVKGNIEGAQSTQLVTDWLWRVGESKTANPGGFATAWTVNFARFMQNVGALGGGNVDISAGGDIRNFSASIPSIGQQVGGRTAAGSVVDVVAGGNLAVHAGSNIEGGSFYIGRGVGVMRADGDISTSDYTTTNEVVALNPVLALGDAQWQVSARGSAAIEAVVNPTLLPQAKGQSQASSQSMFVTYTDASEVAISATAGDAAITNKIEKIAGVIDGLTSDTVNILSVYAPNLSIESYTGDVSLARRAILYPAANAKVQWLAENNIVLGDPRAEFNFVASDAAASLLPTIQQPYDNALGGSVETFLQLLVSNHATTPVHANDGSVAHLVARTGDINMTPELAAGTPNASSIVLSMPARVAARGDVIDLPLFVQNNSASDVSSIEAGGDIYYTVSRNENGVILQNSREIAVDGPGALLVTAGGNVDLQTSNGISSRGNLVNINLPDDGASINVLAGLNGKTPDYSAFEQQYLVDVDTYATALQAYVKKTTGLEPINHDAAVSAFTGLSEQQKTPFLQTVLQEELRASAIYAASTDPTKHGDYSRGFTAMNTLFPDGDAYKGDIALYFSRIYTRDGGAITLLTPGGGVNAGLASPPSSFGIEKAADQLGIATQRGGNIGIIMDKDLQVNESRVFAINNSDIMVWSSNGDIDAGRGAKTAISAPEAVINYDRDGRPNVVYSASLAGSGIQTRTTTAEFSQGNVVLAAPRGVVNAGDAGIVAGNLTIAATAVLGADNIKVSGVSVGVPVDTGGLGASLAVLQPAALATQLH
jgi:filamentous hemagglutinin